MTAIALCHFWVRMLLKCDKKEIFCFAPLTGASATSFFEKRGMEVPESIVLVKGEKHYLASQEIWYFKNILGPFRLGLVSEFLPLRFNNLTYDAIAKNRFVFGLLPMIFV
jgi:predicted DCC family thiol-disulfide oxidoreductase YuxK